MPPQFPWPGRRPSSEKAGDSQTNFADQPSLNTVSLDIADTQSSALDSCEQLTHVSPFAPTVNDISSALLRRGSSMPVPITPERSSGTGGEGRKWSRHRREKQKLERRAAPEKALTLFAMRLAVLEKTASNVGTLAFIWATVVLLGGFAVTLKEIDFWFVTVILVIEGARIFSRSHELEWQHQDAGTAAVNLFLRAYHRSSNAFFRSTRKVISTITMLHQKDDQNMNSKLQALENPQLEAQYRNGLTGEHHLARSWSLSRVPIVPLLDRIFRARNISRLLYWMQLLSAGVTTALAVYRLQKHDFTRSTESDTIRNHRAALFIFYSLATFEALVFLLERSYWQFQTAGMKILVRVNEMCGLSVRDLGTTRRFFYDVYSKCLTESVFEGLKMELVDYSLNWLQSDIPGEQLGGLRVLLTFSSNEESLDETLRSMGVKQGAVERLLEMVGWKNPSEHELRKTAADLLSRLVKNNQYSIRVAAVPGSIESISSLLSHNSDELDAADGAVPEYTSHVAAEPLAPKHLEMQVVGLRILNNLAKDPLICARIGLTRGILPRLISFIDTNTSTLCNAEEPEYKIILVKKSLGLLNLLARASGSSGKMLREEISRIVFTIPNLRVILEYGQAHMMLQDVATGILCSMALDDGAVRDMIGRTGGVMRSLFALLLKERVEDDRRQLQLSQKAGEALALLALKSKDNCRKMLRLKVQHGGGVVVMEGGEAYGSGGGKDMVAALVELVADWEVGDLAMNILRSFYAYSEHESCKARIAKSSLKQVFKMVVERSGRLQEAALGLLAQTVAAVGEAELVQMLEEEGLTAEGLAGRLVRLLERLPTPRTALPRLRRFAVELAMALAEHHPNAFVPAFQALRFRSLLHRLADSVSEVENFATFSGVVGVTAHSLTMARLVDAAIDRFQDHPPLTDD